MRKNNFNLASALSSQNSIQKNKKKETDLDLSELLNKSSIYPADQVTNTNRSNLSNDKPARSALRGSSIPQADATPLRSRL